MHLWHVLTYLELILIDHLDFVLRETSLCEHLLHLVIILAEI